MNFTQIFIRRPVMTTLVMSAILIFGVVGYRTLPVSDLPNVDFPTIQVSARLPGASPEMMVASVATPLERQFSTIPGIDSMTSSSSLGSTNITLQFTLDRDIDGAAQDVQTAISTAQRRLPPGMPTPPTFRKVNPADSSILILSLNSPTMPLSTVDEYAENIVAQRISMVSGVAQVNIYGSMTVVWILTGQYYHHFSSLRFMTGQEFLRGGMLDISPYSSVGDHYAYCFGSRAGTGSLYSTTYQQAKYMYMLDGLPYTTPRMVTPNGNPQWVDSSPLWLPCTVLVTTGPCSCRAACSSLTWKCVWPTTACSGTSPGTRRRSTS